MPASLGTQPTWLPAQQQFPVRPHHCLTNSVDDSLNLPAVQQIVAGAHADHVSDRHFSAFIVHTNAVEVSRGRAIEEP